MTTMSSLQVRGTRYRRSGKAADDDGKNATAGDAGHEHEEDDVSLITTMLQSP